MPPIRELPRGQPPKPNVPLYQRGPNQISDYNSMPRLDMNDSHAQAQMKAKMALEHSRTIRPHPYDDTEKDKMLRGDFYHPNDPQLVEERRKCKLALQAFNRAGDPSSMLTVNEQKRLLRDLIQPPRPPAGSPSSTSSVVSGSLAPDAMVEAPFSCLYGYNISIGPEVQIGEGCDIMDGRPVTIGAKTFIGKNVTIMSTMADTTVQKRKGINTPWQARPVVIGPSCYIGDGALIYPGVTLQMGAYVAPREIVKRDVDSWNPPTWTFD
jgi:acetyltransferase-like isoleucine patch superfamily enzyme